LVQLDRLVVIRERPEELVIMFRPTRVVRRAACLIPLAVAMVAIAAAPPQTDTPDELVRRANALLRAGDTEGAEKLYTAAEERAGDPGLVAYNRAAVLFEQKNYREAERHYDRVLDDASCPPERAARAWYNRGTCLLQRGGSIEVYRSAIACFENALDNPAADQEVKDRAPHNLELAKLHWNEERKKSAKPEDESPNKRPPPEDEKRPRPDPKSDGGLDEGDGSDLSPTGAPKTSQQPQSLQQKGDTKATPTEQHNVPANNPNLQPLDDTEKVQNLSPEEAREYMKAAAERRKRELRALLETLYGPDRAGAQDR
jgi:tetratricopeptide (TPR) repeat protein